MKTYENVCGCLCQGSLGIFFSGKFVSKVCHVLPMYYDSDRNSELGSEIAVTLL